jgi:hypothetical protein
MNDNKIYRLFSRDKIFNTYCLPSYNNIEIQNIMMLEKIEYIKTQLEIISDIIDVNKKQIEFLESENISLKNIMSCFIS